jgi:hypothetical protein
MTKYRKRGFKPDNWYVDRVREEFLAGRSIADITLGIGHKSVLAVIKTLDYLNLDYNKEEDWNALLARKIRKRARLTRTVTLALEKYLGMLQRAPNASGIAHEAVFKCTLTGFCQFVRHLGMVPPDMKNPSLGRKDHSKGYIFGNFAWQEWEENKAEARARNKGLTQKSPLLRKK